MCGAGFAGPGVPGDISCTRRDPTTGAILTGPGNQVSGYAGTANGGGPFTASGYLLANTLSFISDNSYRLTGIGVFQVTSTRIQQVNDYPGVHGEIAVDRTGTHVAVSSDDLTVTLFSFNPTGATLTQIAQTTLNQAPAGMSFSCDGNYLAVAHTDNAVSVYSVSASGLQEINGSPMPIAKGPFHAVVACSPGH